MKLTERLQANLTALDEEQAEEFLTEQDMQVVSSFLDKETFEGDILQTDGTRLNMKGRTDTALVVWKEGAVVPGERTPIDDQEQAIVDFVVAKNRNRSQ